MAKSRSFGSRPDEPGVSAPSKWEMVLADAVVETHERVVDRTYREAARTCEAQLGDETARVPRARARRSHRVPTVSCGLLPPPARDPAAPFDMLGAAPGHVAGERADGGKPLVARAGGAAAPLLEMRQEGKHPFGAQVRVVCGRGRNPTFSPPRRRGLRVQAPRSFRPCCRNWPCEPTYR